MSHRILILTAGFGEGHNSAARALKSAFSEMEGVKVEMADVFEMHAPRLNLCARRGYHRVINSAPRLWSGFYKWLDRTPHTPRLMSMLRGPTSTLASLLEAKRPDAFVSTYPAYAWMLQNIRAHGGRTCPIFTVITDALTINSLWYGVPSEAWFVADTGSAVHLLINRSVPSDRLHVTGFPVNLEFARRPTALQPPDPSTTAVRRILYMVNSGRARALKTAKALLEQPDYQVTITAGRDEELRSELQQMADAVKGRAVILGWTDQVPTLLMNHHVVISKAGGATTQESINALCPMIVNQVVPGQEEGNYELLRRHNAAALATTPEEIVSALERIFSRNAGRWHEWRANLRAIAKPEAARTIATKVLATVGGPQFATPDPSIPVVIDG